MEGPERSLGGNEVDEASEHVGTDPVMQGNSKGKDPEVGDTLA